MIVAPREGTSVQRRSNVRLFVSSGPKQVEVPNLVGLSLDSATGRLDDLGLRAHRGPCLVGRRVRPVAELDAALRGVTYHPPEHVEPFDAEDAVDRPSSAVDPAPMGIDDGAVGERRD